MSICSVDGCGGVVDSLGFCSKHYQRLLKRGSTDDYLGAHGVKRVCSVDGCNGAYEAKGLCGKHYKRLKTHGSPEENSRTHAPLDDRFWRYVEKTDDCWMWVGGSKSQNGYGMIQIDGKRSSKVLAHRLSYEIHKGVIPDGMVVMHNCDNPSCVNPDHLSLGTQSQNIIDAFAKGRKMSKPPHKFGESHGASKLMESDAIEILKSMEAAKILAAKYGVHKSAIDRLRSGKTWKHLPR